MEKTFTKCEKCSNSVVSPLKICQDCVEGILSGTLSSDDFVCDECNSINSKAYMVECRAWGDVFNRCHGCAKRNELEYE